MEREPDRRSSLIARRPDQALQEAVALGCPEYCREALENGADPNGASSMAAAPSLLWECCARDMPECARELLLAGADPARGAERCPPIAAAAAIGAVACCRELLAFGADPWLSGAEGMVGAALEAQVRFGVPYDPDPVLACVLACAERFPDPERMLGLGPELSDHPAARLGLEEIARETLRIEQGRAESRAD